MFVSCTVFVLSGRDLCGGPIPRPEKSYRLWCVSEGDQVKIAKTLDTCCEQVEEGRTATMQIRTYLCENLKKKFYFCVALRHINGECHVRSCE
jgi:hypothetical protein